MKPLRPLLHLAALSLLVTACQDDTIGPGGTGSIAIRIAPTTPATTRTARTARNPTRGFTGPAPLAKGAPRGSGPLMPALGAAAPPTAQQPGVAVTGGQVVSAESTTVSRETAAVRPPSVDAVQVVVTGPTSRTVNLQQQGGEFVGTIDNLTAGSYTVTLIGSEVGLATYYGTTSGIQVLPGQETVATVPFNLFIPTLNPFVTPTTLTSFAANFSLVSGAQSYLVEFDADPTFPNPGSFTTTSTPASLVANLPGVFYLRIRAGNPDIPVNLATPSNVESIEILADTVAGTDAASAPTITPGILTGLNILPNGDQDWFAIDLNAGDALTAAVYSATATPASALDPTLTLLDPALNVLAFNDDADSTTIEPILNFIRVPTTGTYYLLVQAFQDSSVGHYELDISLDVPATANSVYAMDAGGTVSCAIQTDESAVCWGENDIGQLGNGGGPPGTSPTTVTGGHRFLSISAGDRHVCGIARDAALYCWGSGGSGQLGDGTGVSRSTPTLVAGNNRWVEVSAGTNHTCAIDYLGAAWCWGGGFSGTLGDGTTNSALVPVAVSGGMTFKSITAGGNHSCGVESTTGNVYCWGDNVFGQLGNGTSGTGTEVSVPALVNTGGVSNTYTVVSAGRIHTCAIATDGLAWCWGYSGQGQVGSGSFTGSAPNPTPLLVQGGLTWMQINSGSDHTCGVDVNGVGWCWGGNTVGQVGNGTTLTFNTPQMVGGGLAFASITGARDHSCGRTTSGAAHCWGSAELGHVGDATPVFATPTAVAAGTNLVSLTAGRFFTCVLDGAGNASCWGAGTSGQLGNGAFANDSTPVAVTGIALATITAGDAHVCGLRASDANAFCWGNGSSGQLGTGAFSAVALPTAVSGGTAWTDLGAGGFATCGVDGAGGAWCWGGNSRGQLGDGTTTNRNLPTAVQSGSLVFQSITLGSSHTCALATDQSAWCWGDSFFGQLGNGMFGSGAGQLTPGVVSGNHQFVQLVAGKSSTCGLATDGTAWCWGYGIFGTAGDGSFAFQNPNPVMVGGGLTFTQLFPSAGYTFCAITGAGDSYCWGQNSGGQLGNGTLTHAGTPVAVALGGPATSIGPGWDHTCFVRSGFEVLCSGFNQYGQLGIGSTSLRTAPTTVAGMLTLRQPLARQFPALTRLRRP